MLVDATHEEETRVAVVDGKRLVDFDYESKYRKPLKGSIFLAKVTRVEPSLQAAFVNFGGNRHGFLPFSEIHPDYFRIPIADREALIAEQEEAMREQEEEDEEEENEIQGEDGKSPDAEDAEKDVLEVGHDDVAHDHDDEDDGPEKIEVGGATGDDDIVENDDLQPQEESETESFDAAGDRTAAEGHPESQAGDDGVSREEESENGNSEEEGGDHRRHRQQHGRGRRGGRGRRRSSHRSRQTEAFGGEDMGGGGDHRRFSLRRKYKIQEVIKRGQIMLVQVSKEERGNKGAAVSTYLSLPGRYCVLMPNSPRGGGVSRKIANYKDRAKMRDIMKDLEVPRGMSVIVRTAGVSRTKAEIKRDLDYLMRLWDNIRELTLQSSAPALVYEEADLIKRAIRDLYTRDVDEIHVAGDEGYKLAKNFMKMMIPSHLKKVVEYKDQDVPLFNRYQIEGQIAEIGEAQVTLPAGGYLVINQTEALVSIDVNSGKATKERHIEETALRTNLEAAEEAARQLRLRDLGGLIVVDFIDMEDRRNNAKVERKMREALSGDRARIQMGRISSFGLMELSRQRLNPSLTESQFELCSHCNGVGRTRTADATSIMVLRAIEEEAMKGRAAQLIVHVSNAVALYLLNYKRKNMTDLEARFKLSIMIRVDESVGASSYRVEVSRPVSKEDDENNTEEDREDNGREQPQRRSESRPQEGAHSHDTDDAGKPGGARRRRGRRGGRRRGGGRGGNNPQSLADDLNEDSGPQVDSEDDSRGNRREPRHEEGTRQDNEERPSRGRERHANAASETPRERSGQHTSSQAAAPSAPRDSEPGEPAAPRAYETVNQPPDKKKKGWWSR
jgi:ribonuclease E